MAVRNGKKAPGSPVVQQIAQALGETQLAALGQIKGRMRTIGSGNPPVRIIPIVGGTQLTPSELEGFGYTRIMVFTHRSSYRKRTFLIQQPPVSALLHNRCEVEPNLQPSSIPSWT